MTHSFKTGKTKKEPVLLSCMSICFCIDFKQTSLGEHM